MTMRVLVVDDERDIRRLLVSDLQSAGYETVELESGEHVLETTLKFRPDVIVLDLTMPGVNGFEALKELKTHPQTARVPVVVASAQTSRGVLTMVREMGAADFLVKPWEDGELVWRIEQFKDGVVDQAA